MHLVNRSYSQLLSCYGGNPVRYPPKYIADSRSYDEFYGIQAYDGRALVQFMDDLKDSCERLNRVGILVVGPWRRW